MSTIIPDRRSARIEGEFVVLLIGMRINRIWRPDLWLPVARAMPRMLAELRRAGPEASGFLGCQELGRMTMVQYWRSFAHLEAYARDPDQAHWPAWVDFNRRIKHARETVGIWHETYRVEAGAYEVIYSGMPLFGLSKVAHHLDLAEDSRASSRMHSGS